MLAEATLVSTIPPFPSRGVDASPSRVRPLDILWHNRGIVFSCPCTPNRDPKHSSPQLAISAWLTSRFDRYHDYTGLTERDRTRFVLFASCWTIFFSVIYMLLFLHSASTGSAMTSVLSHAILCVYFMLHRMGMLTGWILACSLRGLSGLRRLRLSLKCLAEG
jgi:hypothetical protein